MISEYFSLLIIILLAFITPLLFTRIGVPVVVGEILLGLAVGVILYAYNSFTGTDLLAFGEPVGLLADIGFIFLMFLSGLEINFTQLERAGRGILIRGITIFATSLIVAFPLSVLLTDMTGIDLEPAYLTFVLATTSVAIVLTVVREMRFSRTEYGQKIIISALIADLGAMVLIAAYTIRYEVLRTGDPIFGLTAITLFLLIFLFFYLVYRIGSWAIWYYPNMMKKFFRSDDPHEIGIRASLAIIFVFVALSAVIESEALAVIGAFLAGAVISLLFQEGALLGKKLYGIGYGFLIPIFFIHLGITFDFNAVLNMEALILLPTLIGIALAAKMIPSIFLAGGGNRRRNLATGVILTGGLSLMIAAAEIGLRLRLLTPTLHGVLILLAIVFAVVSPIGFKYMYRRFKLEEKS
jgi:Kef-type K+ transport system membrane component KefB